jgi:hypothetical protein
MQDTPAPEPGDLLFLNSLDTETKVSGYIQRKIDPDAAPSDRTFGHVAIVIDRILALEAVPAPDPKDLDKQLVRLPHTVEVGKWSRAELRGGVRLIPIADLVVPAMHPSAELVVLRSPDVDTAARSNLTPLHPTILRLLGSQYSIDALKEKAKTVFAGRLAKFIGAKVDWTSFPIDLATRIDIDDALREQTEGMFPDYALPDLARTYFCSRLILACLRIAELLPANVATEMTTPTGLYQLLTDREWTDVSTHYRCTPDTEHYLHRSPLAHAASYTSTLALTDLAIKSDALTLQVEFIESAMDRMNRGLLDVLA